MQPQRGVIFAIADDADHLPPSALGAAFDELAQQRLTNAVSAQSITDIDRILDRKTVRGARPVKRRVAITDHFAIEFGNHIGQTLGQNLGTAPQQLFQAWCFKFKAGNAADDVRRINTLHCGYVVFAAVAQQWNGIDVHVYSFKQVKDGRNDAIRPYQNKAMISYRQHKKNFEMHRLNLNHLHTFSQVIAFGSFSAAAERLGLTQPAVSLHLRQLEQRLNVRLIERVGKRLKPTSAGTLLLEHVTRIDATVEDALQALSTHAGGVAGTIAIGTGATACIHLLPPILQALRQQFPALDVRVSTGNTDGVLKAVEENRLDLALVTLPATGRSLTISPILEDDFVAIFAVGDPLPEVITPAALVDLPLVVFETGSSTRLLIDEWYLRAGLRIKPVMELGSIEAIKEMVAAGLGYSIVPAMSVAATHHRRGLQVRALTPGLSRTLGIVLRQDKPLSKALRRVIEALKAPVQR